jgi:hypothetical protein
LIVRIAGDAQYELAEDISQQLNELDNQAVAAVEAGDEAQFADAWGKMVELVRSSGSPVGDDDLMGSDVILPPEDITFAEASNEFTGEGLIPD